MSERPGSRPEREEPEAPVLPERSDDDRDTGWSGMPEDDDERLTRERPPHW